MKASAWIETNRSACTRRALRTRSCSGTKKSASRVSIARMPGTAFSRSRSCSAMASTTSFSRRPLGPMAPGSSPPWPGSSATMIRRSTRRALASAVTAAARAAVRHRPGRRGRRRGAGAGRPGLSTRAIRSPSASCTACARARSAASFSRISASSGSGATRRVQVEHQPVLVGRHRRQREAAAARPAASGRTPAAPRAAGTGRRARRRCTGRRACTLPTSSRSAGSSSRPSMSTTSRGGSSISKWLATSAASDSIVTRV